MNYLARIKQIEVRNKLDSPPNLIQPIPPKAPSVGFVSALREPHARKNADSRSCNPASLVNANAPHAVPDAEDRIYCWLAQIGESDVATIREVIDRTRSDVEAREYFLGRAGELNLTSGDAASQES